MIKLIRNSFIFCAAAAQILNGQLNAADGCEDCMYQEICIPQGAQIPLHTSIQGNFLSGESGAPLILTAQMDLMVRMNPCCIQLSYDGLNWVSVEDLISDKISVNISESEQGLGLNLVIDANPR